MLKWTKVGMLMLMLVLCMVGVSAQASSLGTAGDYNVFVLGDYTAMNSDVQGRLAAGGDVSLENYGVGDKLSGDAGTVLVAGGNLTITNGQVNHGDAVVGGTATLSGFGIPNGELTENADVPVDFDAEWVYLTELSTSLAQMSATGTAVSNNSTLMFEGDGISDLQVFYISDTDFSNSTFSNMEIPTDATVVINISGTLVDMSNIGMQSFANLDNVLFNFYEAEALTISGVGVYGSILAPLADITANNGQINGTVVAKSWRGAMQVNNAPFEGDIPPAPVPEPSTLLLLGSGVLGLMGALHKKRA